MANPVPPVYGGSRLDGVRVLVVDDAPEVRGVVTDILELDGAQVTAVGSGKEALAALQWERSDVLLSDLAMPGKGRYWLIGQVRALPPERGGVTPATPTGYRGPEHRASIPHAGFQFYVEKPVSLNKLVATVAILASKEYAPSELR
jgi:CheY-like chemotaxis protein